ncbi:ammonia channel protein, partial [Burkholderia pseudomallei]
INSGDTAWMLTSTALVLLMTIPGLALFYGGMVRKKNVLATVMQSFAITALITVLWTVVVYSLAFTPGNGFIGAFSR